MNVAPTDGRAKRLNHPGVRCKDAGWGVGDLRACSGGDVALEAKTRAAARESTLSYADQSDTWSYHFSASWPAEEPAIHDVLVERKAWMAGTSLAMTWGGGALQAQSKTVRICESLSAVPRFTRPGRPDS
jgi:hypothetical protein